MAYHKYDKYKESNIPWLGEIPEHWEVSKAKHILYQKKKTLNPELNCGSISFGNIVFKDDERVPIETKATYQELLVGEFLINPLNLNFDLKSLRTALSDKNVVVSTGYIVLQDNKKSNKRYLKWLLHQFDVSFMKTLGDGVRQTLSYTQFKNTEFPNISLSEQTAIANFLDFKLEKINRFITKKKQLIELLTEQKAAIINQAVTKGINPNTKLKPSGIELLGDIPEHWKIKPLKYFVTYNDEALPNSTDKSYKLNYIDISNVNKDGEIDEIVKYTFQDAPSRARRIVKKGDVILSTVRTYLKAIAKIENDEDVIVSTGFAVLRPIININSEFLNSAVRANYFIEAVCANSFGEAKRPIGILVAAFFNISSKD